MNRRELFALVGAVAGWWPFAARAQQAVKVPRVGYLGGNVGPNRHLSAVFRQGMRDLGYREARRFLRVPMR